MAIVFLTTLAAQVGSACFNHYRNHKHAQKMAKIQREFEEKSVRDGINNARAEFAEMCALQREMERDMHQDRLQLIHKHHEDGLWSEAYRDALEKWPLLSPPYVIANAPLTLGHIDQTPIPLNCILTTSNDLKFNNAVFYKIEEELALFCSKYWNASTKKSIRFFQEMWRNNATDIGSRHRDIYALLQGVPTLVISPFFRDEILLFKVYWWGLSTNNAEDHVEQYTEFNPELTVVFPDKVQYTQEMIDAIISECTPKLQAFISYFADLYYWNFYRMAPTLPTLIANKHIEVENANVYLEAYVSFGLKYSQPKIGHNIDMNRMTSVVDLLNFATSVISLLRKDELISFKSTLIESVRRTCFIPNNSSISRNELIADKDWYLLLTTKEIGLLLQILLVCDNKFNLNQIDHNLLSVNTQYIQRHSSCILQDIEFLETDLKKNDIYTKLAINEQKLLADYLDYYKSFIVSSCDINDYNNSENDQIVCGELDIIDYIEQYEDFIKIHSDRFEKKIYLYIRKLRNEFQINLMDSNKHVVITNPKFGYNIRFASLKHSKNTNYVFRSSNGIICSFEKIPKLKEQILKQQLIF